MSFLFSVAAKYSQLLKTFLLLPVGSCFDRTGLFLMASNQNILTVTVPPGAGPGQLLTIKSPFDGQNFQVQIPTGNGRVAKA